MPTELLIGVTIMSEALATGAPPVETGAGLLENRKNVR